MAAGLGFKTFTTGEVLTAADTNGYLMQGVLVFASSAARAAAITSPQEGQYSYLKDTNSTEYYDGAAWIAAPIGDITGVTAGTGISGGGTSGTVTVSIDTAVTVDKTTAQTLTNKTLTSPALTTPTISTATTNGDILYGTGSGALARLGIGSASQVLTVASGIPSWATPASSGSMTSIATGTLSNQQLSITSISGSYNRLVFVLSNLTAAANYDLAIRFNGDSGSNYGRGEFRVDSTNTNNAANIGWDERIYFNSNTVDSTVVGTLMLDIPFYALANTRRLGSGGAAFKNGFNAKNEMFAGQFVYYSTTAITSIATTATNLSGTYTLYGVN